MHSQKALPQPSNITIHIVVIKAEHIRVICNLTLWRALFPFWSPKFDFGCQTCTERNLRHGLSAESSQWFRAVGRGSVKKKSSGFTLIELLVATAVFMVLAIALSSIANYALTIWSRNERKSDMREAARSAINLLGSELRQAVLPVNLDDLQGLQLVVNPAGLSSASKNRDSIFWQAPLATSRTKGDLAIVGYFVRKEGNVYKLCRLFINPDDPDYSIYKTGSWLTDDLLSKKASATDADNFQGLVMENVPGMWVSVFKDATATYPLYDSRVEKKLPARVEISLALIDKVGADRVASGSIQLPNAQECADLATFLDRVPDSLKPHMQSVTVNVPFFL